MQALKGIMQERFSIVEEAEFFFFSICWIVNMVMVVLSAVPSHMKVIFFSTISSGSSKFDYPYLYLYSH